MTAERRSWLTIWPLELVSDVAGTVILVGIFATEHVTEERRQVWHRNVCHISMAGFSRRDATRLTFFAHYLLFQLKTSVHEIFPQRGRKSAGKRHLEYAWSVWTLRGILHPGLVFTASPTASPPPPPPPPFFFSAGVFEPLKTGRPSAWDMPSKHSTRLLCLITDSLTALLPGVYRKRVNLPAIACSAGVQIIIIITPCKRKTFYFIFINSSLELHVRKLG